VPASQEAHVADELAPVALEYVPARQEVHVDAPPLEYVPATHEVHVDAPAREYVPARQEVHVVDAPAPENVPAGHDASDCALFLSLVRSRSFARARAHSLSFSLSMECMSAKFMACGEKGAAQQAHSPRTCTRVRAREAQCARRGR